MDELEEENGANASYWMYDAKTCAEAAADCCKNEDIKKEILDVVEKMRNILTDLYEEEEDNET